jgi:hypothetical protein
LARQIGVIENSLCSMVARPSVIFGDGTKNFLDDDLLPGALLSNREVDIFALRMASHKFFATLCGHLGCIRRWETCRVSAKLQDIETSTCPTAITSNRSGVARRRRHA